MSAAFDSPRTVPRDSVKSTDQGVCRARIPLWGKLAFTGFVCVLIPKYWIDYTPLNFLYFCDVALFLTLVSLWADTPLFASMAAVGIMLPQTLWIADLILFGLFRVHMGLDLTAYMFDPDIPLFTRLLSLYHAWLPLLLLWMLWRQGYDRRALSFQIALACFVLLLTWLLVRTPDTPAANVNKIFGPIDGKPQTYMPRVAWMGCLMLFHAAVIITPTHLVLRRVFLNVSYPNESV